MHLKNKLRLGDIDDKEKQIARHRQRIEYCQRRIKKIEGEIDKIKLKLYPVRGKLARGLR